MQKTKTISGAAITASAHPTSAHVRARLVEALRLDLIGPFPEDSDYAEEILPESLSRWYLTGFLVPFEVSSSHPFVPRSDVRWRG